MKQKTEEFLKELSTRQGLCCQVLKQLPEGKLTMYNRNGHEHYNGHFNGTARYLRDDDPMIRQLKDRYLVVKTLGAIQKQIKLLQRNSAIRVPFDPNELISTFPRAYQNPSTEIIQAIGFEDERVWALQPYVKNPKHREQLKVRAMSGLMVRSRIEAALSEIYDDLGIPYRYDELLVLPNGKHVYTDFHPLISGVFRDLRHEHFGMMTDPDYLKNEFLWKHDQFVRAGMIPCQDILYTFDGPNMEVDKPLLRRQILAWIDRVRRL